MTFTRRAFLGFGLRAFGGCAAAAMLPPETSEAARYVNASGLQRGQFVWQPGPASDGHLLILVAQRQQMLHVYRAGREIGFAPVRVAATGQRPPLALFTLHDLQRDRRARAGSSARDPRLAWHAMPIHGEKLDALTAQPLVVLPDEFATLLFNASQRGATVVTAEERALATSVKTSLLPLLDGLPAAHHDELAQRLLTRMGRTAEAADLMGDEATIVISTRSRMAALVRQGKTELRTRVQSAADTSMPSGSYLFSLTGRDERSNGFDWQAVGIARTPQASHLADDDAARALSGVRFTDPAAGAAMYEALGRGALLYVTDAALGPSHSATAPVEVLANREQAAPAAVAHAPVHHAQAHTPSRSAKRMTRFTRTVELPESPPSKLATELFKSGQ